MSPSRAATRAALEQLIGDKYEVMNWIGGGGMAEVFLARHRSHGGKFAVKVLADHLASDPRVVARFMEEARTAATLGGHPNIAAIFDVGGAGTVHYLIMPYVDGEDVSHYLQRNGPLPGPEVIAIARQVADALAWASERHIVHRDLKPSNIRIDLTGRVMVLDFGIAKAADSPTGLTTAGETPGTPYYMSPEQIRGEPCDTRSDLYSLGIVLFELLTGKKPFDGETVRAIEYGHLEKLPPALSTMITVDAEIEQIINRLLEKEPDRRYATAAELHEELRGLSEEMPPVRLKPQIEGVEQDPFGLDQSRGGGRLDPGTRGTGIPPVTPPPEPPQPRPTPIKWLAPAGALVAVLAAIGGGVWWMNRSPAPDTSTRQDSTGAGKTPPRTFKDAQGAMFLVPAGKFIFGDDSPESPNKRQDIELPAFYVDATEVSNEQYGRFVRATNHPAPANNEFRSEPNLPVTGVTYDDAVVYCAWAGRRLPTEAEWEKAARGTEGSIFPWGSQPMPSPGKIVAVDEYPERQSPNGALNMAGNVFEWTSSPYAASEKELEDMGANTGGKASQNWRCLKGGSFLVKNEIYFRCYMRRGWPVDMALPSVGFRCVKDAK